MATEYVRSEEKHKTLKDAVDSIYLTTLGFITKLEGDLKYNPVGVILDYPAFQSSFITLFNFTKNEPEMGEQHKDLIEKIEHWQYNGSVVKKYKSGNKKIVKEGIKLANEWNSAIRSRDVIKL